MATSVRPSEASVVAAAERVLQGQGYRTRVDPDGSGYFDLVAWRADAVGLLEAKVGDTRTVLRQALVRRVWGDWTAVAVAGRTAATRLEQRTRSTRAAPIGVWAVHDGRVEILRPAGRWVVDGMPDPYAGLRRRFRALLQGGEEGSIPSGLAWDGVPGAVRRISHGRRFREWRLDEIVHDAP